MTGIEVEFLDDGGQSAGAVAERLISFLAEARTTIDVAIYDFDARVGATARIADAKKLDRTAFVGATGQQTLRRERTLIENANLIGLLSSINDRLRERVSDALVAGAPQPTAP